MVYKVNGQNIRETGFDRLIKYEFKRDSVTGAFYTVTFIPQNDGSGNKQYPFVLWPNYPNGGIESTLEMNRRLKFLFAMNSGGFYSPYTYPETGGPLGPVIQNGEILYDPFTSWTPSNASRTLTIDSNGTLGYERPEVTGEAMLAKGIVSCCWGSYPLIVNYANMDDSDEVIAADMESSTANADAQRQCICQYENGDYLIITSEGRSNRGSGFFTYKRMQAVCREYGVKFAFLLDGGGSAETVMGDKQLNNIYEAPYGRPLPVYIVFNGTTQFKASNAD